MTIINMVGGGGSSTMPSPLLCFTALTSNSTISLTKTGSPTSVTLETSSNGNSWTTYTIGNTITLSKAGDKVYWRNTSTTDTGFSTSTSAYYKFVMTGVIAASGDINHLLNKNSTTSTRSYCYYNLFNGCASLVQAPELPSKSVLTRSYGFMFNNCTNLRVAPALPATIVYNYAYYCMFQGCTSLVQAPALPATTLNTYCYANMFYGCTSLNTLPTLPATTLKNYCYQFMFSQCSNIKISSSKTGAYQTAFMIPSGGGGTDATSTTYRMLGGTGGTFTSDPSINTTYYTSNALVS